MYNDKTILLITVKHCQDAYFKELFIGRTVVERYERQIAAAGKKNVMKC